MEVGGDEAGGSGAGAGGGGEAGGGGAGEALSLCLCLALSGFQLRHFLQDEETVSDFLRSNASFSEHDVQQIRDADINLEKVSSLCMCAVRADPL